MEANELRIGNLIRHKTMNMFRVDQLHLTDHQGYVARMYFNNDLESYFDLEVSLAEPIPMTEEILLKCGFKKKDPQDLSIRNIEFFINSGSKDGLYLNGYFIANIKYLHQLQNLYFAITGEELEIKI